jgi:ATP-dependent RNA helicase DDX56/DBP9
LQVHPDTRKTSGLILVPTRELAEQVHKTILSFTTFCAQDIRAINLTHKVSETVQRSLLADSPDIVIATPARASSNISSAVLDLQNLSHLVIDEADLLLSYGYEDDLKVVSTSIPKGVQTFLMSATLTSEVRILKGQFCKNPVILKLEEGENPNEGVSQYVVRYDEPSNLLLES